MDGEKKYVRHSFVIKVREASGLWYAYVGPVRDGRFTWSIRHGSEDAPVSTITLECY